MNVFSKQLLDESAIIIEAGEGKEDRLMSGSYRQLRREEAASRRQQQQRREDEINKSLEKNQDDPFGAKGEDPFGNPVEDNPFE